MRETWLIIAIVLAGCIGDPDPVNGASFEGASLALEPIAWTGRELAGPDPTTRENLEVLTACLSQGDCPPARTECGPLNCERHALTIANAGTLTVGLRWPSIEPVWMALWIEDASGKLVAEGFSTTIDHNGASAVLEGAQPGLYSIVVASKWGTSTYEVAARLTPAPVGAGAARDLLPDLVTLPPTDLRFEDPPGHFVMNMLALPTNGLAEAVGAKHCSFDEASAGARLCLRFTNAVGNAGEGPLDIALLPEQGATSAAGGRFVQRIRASDGSERDSPAGPAEFHAIHGHWHNAGSNFFTVYEYDNATWERGAPVSEGRKTGMCFADVGIIEPAHATLQLPAHGGYQCFNPVVDREWSMGLAPGWYDAYPWLLNDQYVDVAGLADGTYLLCSVANAEASLVESDPTNNEGCTAFLLDGGAVKTLDPLPYHAEPIATR